MRNYFSLPQFNPGDMRINTAPVQNALEAYGAKTERFGQIERQQQEQTYQRGREAKADTRQDETWKMQNLERLGKSAFAYSQLPPEQRDPQTWGRMVKGMQSFDPSIGTDPDDLDPVSGPAKFAAVYGGQVRDPREDKLMDLKVAQAQKSLAAPVGGEAPSAIREMEAVQRMTPEQRALYWRVKRANPLDKVYATQYGTDVLQGGNVDATKNMSQLKDVQTRLESGNENLTGPVLGMMPDSIKAYTNPGAIDARDTVQEVVQRNLRAILGGQFAAKEGEQLIARAYNPQLEEKENAKRLGRLYTAMDEALKQKQAAADYMQEYGTIQGFQGKTEWSVADFEKAMEGNVDQQLPTINDPSQARGLPSGTRFKTPDGRVMEVP
jgi:hypothetical protein